MATKFKLEDVSEIYMKGSIGFKSLVNATKGTHPKDTRECFRCSIKNPELKDTKMWDVITAGYEDPEDRFTPTWVRKYLSDGEAPEYFNFKSNFPLKVIQIVEGKETVINAAEVINGAYGAMKVKIIKKDGALSFYPMEFLVLKNGTPKNNFADLDF